MWTMFVADKLVLDKCRLWW